MAILLNGIAHIEYDRDKPLPDHPAVYLETMDAKMDEGILIGDQMIKNPDSNQKAQFVSSNLAHAILTDNEPQAASMTTYLATRLPDLKQVKIVESNGEVMIDLVFDEEYKKQVAVQFTH